VNSKGQLIKITPIERNGRMTELHQILSFDIDKLPLSATHKYGVDMTRAKGAGSGGILASLPRAKVPVKDGMSQSVSK